MAGSVSLREFGYNFCGPLLWSYTQKVVNYLENSPSDIYCLAREGYLFREALERILPGNGSTYLYASRTFLFRISLHDPRSWQYSLTHAYEGTLENFFVSRFGFTQREVSEILERVSGSGLISLPNDIERLKVIVGNKRKYIQDITSATRNAYLKYLESKKLHVGSDNPILFLDIGYSGTIQKLLTLLLSRNTSGYYFITTNAKKDNVDQHIASLYYAFKDGVRMGDGYDLLDRSMFLESLFTSPDGQFIDIRESVNDSQDFNYFFGKRGYTQEHFEKLDVVFDGALDAVEHFNRCQIQFSEDELEKLYINYVYHRNLIPSESWPLFEFDDAISGLGHVNPLHFFGL